MLFSVLSGTRSNFHSDPTKPLLCARLQPHASACADTSRWCDTFTHIEPLVELRLRLFILPEVVSDLVVVPLPGRDEGLLVFGTTEVLAEVFARLVQVSSVK